MPRATPTHAGFLTALCLAAPLLTAPLASGQSSSLYVEEQADARLQRYHTPDDRNPSPLFQNLAHRGLAVVQQPEPRTFAIHDLVTIVIRESIRTDMDAKLDTSKEGSVNGKVNQFPSISLGELFREGLGVVGPDPNGGGAQLDLEAKRDFKGDGKYSRSESMTTRVTARIIDVKPNGTLVLEARKNIKQDKEELTLVVTGTCRSEDITYDNTVLSTQLYDLRLNKQHKGELRGATRKGILTKVFEVLFDF